MIQQDLAAKILNVLFTASENKGFSGDEADRDSVLSQIQASEEKLWKVYIPVTTYTVQQNEMPCELSTSKLDPTTLNYEDFASKIPNYDATLTGYAAIAAMRTYLENNIKDDSCVENTEKTEKSVKMSIVPVETSYNKDTSTQPLYPIGFDANKLNEIYKLVEDTTWEFGSVEELKQHLKNFLIKGLEQTFGNVKSEILRNSKYYSTSSALPMLEEKELSAGQKEYSTITKALSKVHYKIYTIEDVTYYAKLTAPSGRNTVSSTFEKTRTVVTVEEKTLTEQQAAAFIDKYVLRYYAQAATATAAAVYPDTAYIGLFTDFNPDNVADGKTSNGMPNTDGTDFREPPYKDYSDESDPRSYQRMNLHRGLFSDEGVFESIQLTNNKDKHPKHEGCALLENKEIIMFPEVLNPAGWGNISGFGIFTNPVAIAEEKPFFWGEVESTPADEGSVPLFRPEDFRIYLG